ncbi:AraC family transcriptional regulator [Niveibacterium sp. SC-1]|uniref:AraC family transcriptional regulator n=1 Tax=Niveibacterium sp. SC-1 TaxID=3135646 RepID=UPI00311FF13B
MQTFLSNSLPLLERLARAHGLELATPVQLRASARLPTELYDRACAELAARAREPSFGLRAGELWHPSDFGALGYAWFAATTLRTALLRLVRFSRLLGDRGTLALEDTRADGAWLDYAHRRGDPALDRVGSEIILSVVLSLCRRNCGEAIAPSRVLFASAEPPARAPYDEFFGCRVEFDAGRNAMLLPEAIVDAELPTANREIASTLDELLTRQLADLDQSDFVARSKTVLLESLADGMPEAGEIARRLNVSERTLQRRLAQRQTSFHELVDETRRELATAYLEDTANSVTEVAFRVGFATPSAFSRAFMRWTGHSPSDWRRSAHD